MSRFDRLFERLFERLTAWPFVGLFVALSVAACSDEPATEDDKPAASARSNAAPSVSFDAVAAGDVTALLAALHQSHAQVRGEIGPHRLRIRTSFDLAPSGDAATPEPAVDEKRPLPQHVDDEIDLLWLTTAVNTPRFSLTQSNEHDRGRDVLVDGDRVYTRQRNRTWFVAPVQSDVFELWLDDAQRSVHDIVALAAVQLAVSASRQESAIVLTLSRASAADPTKRVADPRSAWRSKAQIDAVAGSITLDASTLAWVTAKLDVSYSMPGPDGRTLVGRVTIDATREAAAADSPLPIPADAQPIQERTRYDAERARLLDGLAGG